MRGSDRFRTDGVDKSTVNFQIIERKTLKIDKRAVPGAEVINSNFYADRVQPGEELCGFLLFQHIALGNFQHNLEMVCEQDVSSFWISALKLSLCRWSGAMLMPI